MKHVTVVKGQRSWEFGTQTVRAALTESGGMLAPVTYFADSSNPVSPYHIAPWAEESRDIAVPVLRTLRGDFFCLPFGANASAGEGYTVHGDTATKPWKLVEHEDDGEIVRMHLSLESRHPAADVTKTISLRTGDSIVYSRHVVTGGSGKVPLGHHATLATPVRGVYRVSTSPFMVGLATPRPAGPMADDEYFAVPPLAVFDDLASVPTIWTEPATVDCRYFPRLRGFSDIISLNADPSAELGWTAAVAEEAGYCWFGIKDPRVLPTTVLWIEETGRRAAPWDGRNVCIGLEEVCGYVAEGLPASAKDNPVSARGVHTAVALDPDRPTMVNYIQGVVRVNPGFGEVVSLVLGNEFVEITGSNGTTIRTSACGSFLATGEVAR